jgi:hypothetical protein
VFSVRSAVGKSKGKAYVCIQVKVKVMEEVKDNLLGEGGERTSFHKKVPRFSPFVPLRRAV